MSNSEQHQISIIIPILNEKAFIGKLLHYLQSVASKKRVLEIIIVDGGSTDGSQEIVKHWSERDLYEANKQFFGVPVMLLKASKGRAKQMNFGANKASGDILYFLHTDSFPPKYFDVLILNEIQKGHHAGCFRMQFNSNHWWLKLSGWFTKFNWRLCRGGDQSLFVSKHLFDSVGGYDERFVIYEDNVFINELYKRKKFVVINKKLCSSARMYRKHGIWKLQYYYWSLHLRHRLGANAHVLYHYYKKKVC